MKSHFRTFRLKLAVLVLAGLVMIGDIDHAQAQPVPEPAPLEAVEAEALSQLAAASPVVVELFSSQACVFCPRADRLFANIAPQDNVIALACHIDYFDVSEGTLSQPFCSARQADYMRSLGAGPHYTPQMVINGRYDVVGYQYQNVLDTLRKAKKDPVEPVRISRLEQAGKFQISMALPEDLDTENTELWIFYFDRPHNLTIAQGRNRGETLIYKNIVSALTNLGRVPAGMMSKIMEPDMKDHHAGFALIVQNIRTGHIQAAGLYQKPE